MKTMRRLFAMLLAVAVLLVNGSVAALAENVLSLPAALQVIEEEAFYGNTSIDKVVLPEGVTAIGARAFLDSTLSEINLPASLTSIDDSAFDGPEQVTVTAQEGTYAYDWAVANGYIRQPMVWPESAHNYLNNSDETWEYVHHENAAALKVTFDPRTYFEENFDFLYITDSTGKETRYSGDMLAGVTLILPGHRFSLRLTSDGSETRYGFTITDITAMSRQEYQDYLDYLAEHPYDVRVMGDGSVEITGYRGTDTELTIPAEIDGVAVTGISVSAFAGNTTITEVTIPEGVAIIRSSAFRNCPNLTKVVIPGSVKKIDSRAFYGCDSLNDVTLKEGIERIEYEAFAQCESLTKITLPASLKTISYEAFEGSGLQTVIATPGTYAYAWAVERGYITPEGDLVILPFASDGVSTDNGDTLLWDLLSGSYSYDLQILTYVSADTTVEWSADWIRVQDYDWNDVASGDSFITPSTRSMYINLDYNMTGAARTADLVFTCGEITRTLTIRQLPFMTAQLTAPADLGLDWYYYDEDAATPRVYYAKGNLEFVWNLVDGATGYEFGLRTPNNYEDSGESAHYWDVEDEDIRDGAIHLTIPADELSPTNRMDHTVILRVYDQYGHEYNNRYRFGVYDPVSPEWGYKEHCIWDENDEKHVDGVTITGYSGSSATPVVPAAIGDLPVVCLEGTFEENREITSVTLPDTLTDIGSDTFSRCENLASIMGPDGEPWDGGDVTWIGYGAFYGCSSLTAFTIPSGVTYINEDVFTYCTGLTEITIPDSVTYIEYDAFEGCTGLTEITIPGSVRSIDSDAFSGCTGLQTLTMLEGVEYIGWRAFSGCSSLSKITLPASVTNISEEAFDGCESVTQFIAPEGSYAYGWGIAHGFIHEDYVFESAHPVTGDDDLNYSFSSEHYPEAEALKLTFSAACRFSNLTLSYDGGSDSYSGDWRGNNSLAGKTIVIPGNHFDINLSYNGNQLFGFGITAIEPVTAEEMAAWRDANPFIYQDCEYWEYDPYGYYRGIEITGYRGTATEVVIPSTIDGKQVLRISGNVFTNRSDVTSVVVSEGVRCVNMYAFAYCSGLTSVTLPESIREILMDGDYTLALGNFYITAPEGSYAYAWAVENGFVYEESVLESDHPYTPQSELIFTYTHPEPADHLKVTFSGRTYVDNIWITDSNGNTTNYGGDQLKGETLYLPGDTFTVQLDDWSSDRFGFRITDITPMTTAEFDAYRAEHPFLTMPWNGGVAITGYIGPDTALEIPDTIDGKTVNYIDYRAFANHTELTSVVIPDSVTSMNSYVFENCTSLTSVTLPGSLTYINNDVFNGCSALEEVIIPDGLQYIYDFAFGYCSSLTSISLPASVRSIEDSAFQGCNDLVIDAPEGSYAYDWAVEHGFVYEESVLESDHPYTPQSEHTFTYTHPEPADILKVTFSYRSYFNTLTLTDGEGNSKYYDWDSLSGKTVYLPGDHFTLQLDTSSSGYFGFRITDITPMTTAEYETYIAEHPFLTQPWNDGVAITGYIGTDTALEIPDTIDGKTVYHIEIRAFENHTELRSVVIPDTVTLIYDYAFQGCTSLEHVTLPNGLNIIEDHVFSGCSALEEIIIPDSVQSIYSAVFSGCTSLTSIVIPDSVTYMSDYVFQGCTGLQSVTLPSGLNTIRYSVFYGCSALEEVIIPDGLQSINSNAFGYCSSLTSISLPESVNSITDNAFDGCNDLIIDAPEGSYAYDWAVEHGFVYEESVLESDHPYTPQSELIFTYTHPEPADHLKVTFSSRTYVDNIWITDSNGNTANYGGDQLKGETLYLPSDHFTIRLDDWSSNCFGFRITDITPMTTAEFDAYRAEHPFLTRPWNGGVAITGYIGPDTALEIPDTIDGKTVNYIDYRAFANHTELTSVVIPDSVTSMGSYVFDNCTSLTSVTLSGSLTYINNGVFYGCSALEEVSIPDSVQNIYSYVFSGCTSLTSIVIPDSVTYISSYVFENCTGLTSVTLPGSLTYINNDVFNGCSALEEVIIPDGLQYIYDFAFGYCSSLTSISLPASVSSIDDSAFQGCNNLIIDAPEGSYAYDWAVEHGFVYEESVLESDHPYTPQSEHTFTYTHPEPADHLKVTFSSRTYVNNIWITDSNGNTANYYSNQLRGETLFLPGNSFTIQLDDWSSDCFGFRITDITPMTTAEFDAYRAEHPFQTRPWNDGMAITSYIGPDTALEIPDTIDGKTVYYIDNRAFSNHTELTSVVIPDSVTSMGSYVFENCTSLTSVTLSGSLTYINNGVFYGCSALEEVIIPDSVQNIYSSVFSGCTSLTSIVIPDSVTSMSDNVFQGCTGLQSVTLPSGLNTINYSMFYGCSALEEVIIPDGLQNIYSTAFGNCSSLTSISLPASVSYISDTAFQGCNNLIIDAPEGSYAYDWAVENGFVYEESVLESDHPYTPESELTFTYTHPEPADILKVTFSNRTYANNIWITDSNGNTANYGGDQLKGETLYLPSDHFTIRLDDWSSNYFGFRITDITPMTTAEFDAYRAEHPFQTKPWNGGVAITGYIGPDTALEIPDTIDGKTVYYIDSQAFSNHTELTSVVIPGSVTSIHSYAFAECTGLTSVTLSNGLNIIEDHVFYGCSALEEIIIPDSVQNIYGSVFSGCTSLTSIVIPDSVTYISSYVFENCTGLTSVTLPGSLTYINNGVFYGCAALEEVIIPDGLQSINSTAFGYCSSLTSISLPASVSSIDDNAFQGCNDLIIDAPEGSYAYDWALEHGNVYEESVLESDHPYTPESELTFTYTHPEPADILKVTFSNRTYVNDIWITDSNGSTANYYSDQLKGETLFLPGNSFTIRLDDWTSGYFGFRITDITPMTTEEYNAYRAENPFDTQPYDDGVQLTAYYGSAADLVIPATIDGKPVRALEDQLFSEHNELTSVVIPDSVEYLGNYTFQYCTNLTSVVLPANIQIMPNGVFNNCLALTDIAIPSSVENISNYAFTNCTSLTGIYLSENVNSISEYAFGDAFYLVIDAPEGSYAWNWAQEHGFVYEESVFESDHPYYCDDTIDFPYTYDGEADMLKVTFSFRTDAPGITVTQSDGSSKMYPGSTLGSETIFVIGNSFTVSLSSCPQESGEKRYGFRITDITPATPEEYAAFRTEHPFMTIPADSGNISIAGYIGTDTDLTIPESIDGKVVDSIYYNAFKDNTQLTSVIIPDGVSSMLDEAFSGCTGLTHVSLPANLWHLSPYTFYGCSALTEISIPSGVTYIGSLAFGNCTSLTSVILPESLVGIDINAFFGCTNLTITAPEGSYAYGWAQDHNIPVVAGGSSTPEPIATVSPGVIN